MPCLWPRNDLVHTPQAGNRHGLNHRRICHDAGDPVVLSITNFLISDALVSLEQAQPSLGAVGLPNPWGPSPYVLLTPNLGNLASRLWTKKQIRDATRIKPPVQSADPEMVRTGLHGCQRARPKPQTQTRLPRKHSIPDSRPSTDCPLQLAKRQCKCGQDQNFSLTPEDMKNLLLQRQLPRDKQSLSSLTGLDTWEAPGCLSAEQGRVCAVASATGCTWTDTGVQVETQLPKSCEHAS